MKVEEIIKQSGIEPYKTSGSCKGVFYLNQVIEIAELYATHPTTTEMQCDEGCEYECTKGGTQPKSCETLQEGDWTKCEKFSEWVSLLEIEGCSLFFEDKYDTYKGMFKSFFNKEGNGGLNWGKGENFLPYQEFKQRAENTFKTK